MAFQDRVEKMRKELREEGTPKRSSPGSTPTNVSILSSVSKPDPSNLPKISEQFRPKLGSWECKACYTMNGAKDSSCVSCDSPREKPKSPGPAEVKPGPSLAEMFKPKAGSWECGGCLIVNDADKTICVCCNTPKPGHENDAKESPKSVISFGSSSFSLGINPADDKGTCFNFGIKPTSDAQKSSFTFRMNKPETKSGKAMESQSSSGGPDLGQSSLENKDIDKSKTVSMSGFTFGQSPSPFTFASKTEVLTSSTDSTTPISFETKAPGSGFKFDNLFGDKARTPTKTSISFGATSESTGDKFAFGQSGKFDCNFSRVTKSQSSSKSPRSPATGKETDSEPGDTEEGEGFKDLVFKPVVPLPDKVPLTTGEEDEEVLYSHRAKLYRFSQGEWKERGVGDIKILRHNVTRKIRLLMRREPILKICLNHLLSTDQVFSPKDDRSWYWKAQDYIEGELRNEVFCLRVKSPEIAQDFKRAVESAQGEVEALKSVSSGSSPSTAESDDAEVVYEASVSEELRQAALKLLLPPNFYRYLEFPPCPGCVGCESDSEDEEATKKPIVVKPDTSKQQVAKPEISKQQVAKPDAYKQEVLKPDKSQQQVIKPDASKQQVVKPDTSQQQVFKPDASKQQVFKPDASKQQAVKPDTSKATTSVKTTTTTAPAPATIPSVPVTTSSPATCATAPGTTAAAPATVPTVVPVTTTTVSQPFTFSFKTTAPTLTTTSSVFGVASTKKFATTTASTPLLPTPTPPQPNFSFSLGASSAPKVSSAESTSFVFGGSASQIPGGNSSFFSGTPLFQSQPTAQPFFGSPSSAVGTPTTKATSSATQSASTISFGTPNIPPVFEGSSLLNSASKGTFSFSSPSPNSIFGGTSGQSPATVFGATSAQTPASVFGGTPGQSPATVFGATSAQSPANVFGGTSSQSPANMFGGNSVQSPASMFGGTSAQSPASVFGGTSVQSPASVFGTPASGATNSPTGSLFFNNISSFQTPQSSVFGGSSPATASSNTATVGQASEPTSEADTPSSGPTFLFKQTTSFGDIAAAGNKSSLGTTEKGSSQFQWAGAGKTVFGNKSAVVKEKGDESGGDSGGEDEDSEQTHDPFFEPIIPLPDAIEVRTGEEDEEKEFGERAKFFRYDDESKMWKERGIGEMKILRHKDTSTYRLLLRREQVHKVVCNQLITTSMGLHTMPTSDKSICWGGMNMAEEYTEPRLEKVAVRFKTAEIAEEFKDRVKTFIEILKARKEQKTISDILDASEEVVEPEVTVEEVDTEYSDGEEDGDYGYVEESEPMFEKRATLHVLNDQGQWSKISQGELSLVFNTGFNTGSIVFKKDNAEHLVMSAGPESNAQVIDAKQVVWHGQVYSHEEGPRVQQFKADFCTSQAADEFLTVFREVMELSQTYLESESED